MRPNMRELLELSFAELLSIGADTASEALHYWPPEWKEFRRNLKTSLSLMKHIARGRHRRWSHVPFALTEDAFAEIRRAVAPNRLALLVVDAIRSAARACCNLPSLPRIHVSQPTEDELRDRAAAHVHDVFQLLEEIKALCPDGPPQRGDWDDGSQPMFGFSTRPGDADSDDESWPLEFLDWTEHEDDDDESGPFGFR